MFKRTALARYEKDLILGDLFLVHSRLLTKYIEWRSWSNNPFSSDDAYKAYVLAFNIANSHNGAASSRYEFVSRYAYKHSAEGDQYYLVLAADRISVLDIFPCETTTLTPALKSVLERDSIDTGFPVSLKVEQKKMKS